MTFRKICHIVSQLHIQRIPQTLTLKSIFRASAEASEVLLTCKDICATRVWVWDIQKLHRIHWSYRPRRNMRTHSQPHTNIKQPWIGDGSPLGVILGGVRTHKIGQIRAPMLSEPWSKLHTRRRIQDPLAEEGLFYPLRLAHPLLRVILLLRAYNMAASSALSS
jgi:hypothetical protein